MTERLSQDTDEMLRSGLAARRIGVTVRTLKRYIAAGRIKPDLRLPGGHLRFSRETIDAFIARERDAA